MKTRFAGSVVVQTIMLSVRHRQATANNFEKHLGEHLNELDMRRLITVKMHHSVCLILMYKDMTPAARP